MKDEAGSGLRSRLEVAIGGAREAGRIIEHYARQRSYVVDAKGDGSPVTTADREAETSLSAAIRASFPADGILGEEFGETRGASGYRWVLDPIDGTASFVHGVPLYGTLVGIERGGRCVAGVICMSGLDEMVYGAEGMGAWHVRPGGEPMAARVSKVSRLAEAMVCVTSFDYFTKRNRVEEFHRVAGACRSMRGWSDCYGHLLVATGRADAVVEPGVHPWDVAATIAVVREAGGRCTDWGGVETACSGHCVVSNGSVHEELLGILKGS